MTTHAVCKHCEKEMAPGIGCIGEPFPSGSEPIPYEPDEPRNCRDCNAPSGGFHHPGCDTERCPDCGGQAISCDCSGEAP